jgi:hypothetical protein
MPYTKLNDYVGYKRELCKKRRYIGMKRVDLVGVSLPTVGHCASIPDKSLLGIRCSFFILPNQKIGWGFEMSGNFEVL